MATFDWKKFFNVGNHLAEFSDDEEYQRSAVGRYYYACFGLTKDYYESTHHVTIPTKESHNTLIKKLEDSCYDKENELGSLLKDLRRYRNSADYCFFIESFLHGATYIYKDVIVALFDNNRGASTDNYDRSISENIDILKTFNAPRKLINQLENSIFYLMITITRTNTFIKLIIKNKRNAINHIYYCISLIFTY